MKQIKVYLQYPWRFSEDHCYKSLVQYPPRGVEYINFKKKDYKISISGKKIRFLNRFKVNARKILNYSKVPIINAALTKSKEDFDLIHCAHCLSKNKRPWVADTEGSWQFWISGENTALGRKIGGKILLKEYCKKILPWTNEAKKDLFRVFKDEKIRNKIETVYPAVPVFGKKKKHPGINLFFSGRYFYSKGAFDVLDVFDKLTKKYDDVNAILISKVPENIIKKYEKNKKIKIYDLMPLKNILNEILPKSDIWVYPGYSDSFGTSFLEAMAFGIPTVTVDGFARKEIVEDGKTGFVIKNPVIGWNKDFPIIKNREEHREELVKKTSILIENKRLREAMGKAAFKEIESGKFSIEHRNKQLREIYEKAII